MLSAAVALSCGGSTPPPRAETTSPGLRPATEPATAPAAPPTRIVSLVPGVTEMLFAIGAGPHVVGVSSYDNFPPEVASRVRVGALVDPDVERILTLRPDLVVAYSTQENLLAQLARAHIAVFVYQHGDLAQIMTTLREAGRRVGLAAEAEAVARDIEGRLAAVRARVASRPRPRTLLVFGKEPGSLRNVFASGGVGFLHDLLETAGGTNVFADVHRENVQVTTEEILARAPEVIVQLRYGASLTPVQIDTERRSWDALAAVPAVRNRRVRILVGDEFVIPGPRVAAAAERLADALGG